MADLISLQEAAELGIERLRLPIWEDPFDHLKIDIINKKLGPWLHLYAPFNTKCNGRDPVDILWMVSTEGRAMDVNAKSFEIYTGPPSDNEEYRREAARVSGIPQRTDNAPQPPA